MTLSDRQVAQYFDDGFLIVEDLFTARDLLPVMDEIAEAVDDLVERLHAAGRIVERHAEKDLFTRLAAVEKDHPDACVILFKEALMGMRLAELWASKKLLDIVACFIGPDVDGHPIWTLRPKTPVTQLMSVPWHQDDAYFTPGSEETFKVGAWIPFLDVDTHNGCMQVVRGGHKTRPHTLPHHLDSEARDPRSWYVYIDQSDLPPGEVVTCEMEFGSALFINDFTPHRSLENTSDQVRWTVDLRWQRPGLPAGGDATVPMRRAGDPRFRPALAAWIERNRRNREAYGIDMGETPFGRDSLRGRRDHHRPLRQTLGQIRPRAPRRARSNESRPASHQSLQQPDKIADSHGLIGISPAPP